MTYSHCLTEDPDLDAADFVFGHLLELSDLVESFDSDDGEKKSEKPHQPVSHFNFAWQVIASAPAPIWIDSKQESFYRIKLKYPVFEMLSLPEGYLSGLLRPPIV